MEIDYIKIKTAGGYLYGGNQNLFGKEVSLSGCGMIAACDYLLYCGGKRDISFNEYAGFVNKFREEAYFHTSNRFGIYPGKLVRLINSHLTDKKVGFFGSVFLTKNKLEKIINDSLKADLPVIIRIGLNGKKFPYSITYPDRGGCTCCGSIGWHYITVTGMEENGKFIFSSWGGKGEADISELYKYFGITGGIIADKNIITKNS